LFSGAETLALFPWPLPCSRRDGTEVALLLVAGLRRKVVVGLRFGRFFAWLDAGFVFFGVLPIDGSASFL